jgi:hypothetical protein
MLREIEDSVNEELFSYMEMYVGNKIKQAGLLNMLKY